MTDIVLAVPAEGAASFQRATEAADAEVAARVREWPKVTRIIDGIAYIPLRTEWRPPKDRKTADGVAVLLDSRTWPDEVRQAVAARKVVRVSGRVVGEFWKAIQASAPAEKDRVQEFREYLKESLEVAMTEVLPEDWIQRVSNYPQPHEPGPWETPQGYRMLWDAAAQRIVFEHRYIYEKYHGAIPSGYVIHHINGVKNDNRIENLRMITPSEHIRLHAELRRLSREHNEVSEISPVNAGERVTGAAAASALSVGRDPCKVARCDLNGEQSEAPAVAPESVSGEHVLPPVRVGPGQTPDSAVEEIYPEGEMDQDAPTARILNVPAEVIEPVISDEVIDRLTLDAGGLDDLTRTIKTLEHYGAKFPGWFCDRPLADVRAGLKAAARSERVQEAFRREREFEESRQPEICTTGATIHEMSEDALAVVNKWNNPPELFARSACLVRAALDERGSLYIQELDENGLTGILDRLIAWTRLLKGGEERPVHPPREVVRDILSLPAATWRVPHLAGVTGTPIFHQNGIIHSTPGYDAESCLYFYPTPGFTMPPVPEVPTREDVAAALETIGEVFADFPFCGPADRTNAIGALFTAVLRPCIDGPVPLYLTDKPQAGSGAGLLQRVIGWIAEGREPSLKTMPAGPEMRKEVFASLKNGTRVQLFDNIEERLSSPELAAALTASEMTGRILGQTEERTYAVRTFWMANGNNVTVGGDLARRTFKSRIDPQDPMPWQRSGFSHPDLIRWAREARGEILAAVFTVARAWIQAGRPAPAKTPRVGSFEAWRDMIGGILESAGVPDFLGNADEVYLAADEDRAEWENFLQALWERYGSEPFQPARVAELLTSQDPAGFQIADSLPAALAEAFHYKRGSFSQVLGMAFKKVDGRHFPGGMCIRQGKLSRGVRTWVVTYSPPKGVEPWWNLDSPKSGDDCQTDGLGSSDKEGGVSGGTCTIHTREKKSLYKTVMDKGNIPDTNECAIGSEGFHHLHHSPTTEGKTGLDNESSQSPDDSRFHQGSTTPPGLPPIPPGCLKHPIEAYVPRKYDSSILCIVPGCRRHAEYAAGAGFPLCEEHYQAAKRQAARQGGDPR